MKRFSWSMLLCVFTCGSALQAQQATLTGDAYVQTVGGGGALNFGSGTGVNVGGPTASVGLLQFDLSTLPAGTTSSNVQKATLYLFVNKVSTAGSIAVNEAGSSWSEMTVTQATLPTTGSSVASSVALSSSSAFVAIDVTSAVQHWLTGTTNNGLILSPAAGSSVNVTLDSKEGITTSHSAVLQVSLVNQGPTGPQGQVGPQGPQGPIGPVGPQGPAGGSSSNSVLIKPGSVQTSAADNANGSDLLLNLQGTYTSVTGGTSTLRFLHSGGFSMSGFVQDVGNTTGCAALIPATGAGTRFMWHPCRGAVRFGRVPTGQANWDDANMDDFTFAGGNQVTASGYGAFAFGDQVNVSSTVGVGFGSAVTVSGTAGFSSGASNRCTGFACTAIGYTNNAGGQGSVALGYRTTASSDNSVAIGYRASDCSATVVGSTNGCAGTQRVGAIVLGGTSSPTTQTSFVNAQADGEFRVRAPGGIAFRTSVAANAAAGSSGNTGCDLPAGSGTFTCASSKSLKQNFRKVNGEVVLRKLRTMPLMNWQFIGEQPGESHIGPFAEDFQAAFKLSDSDKSIGMQDLAGVSLVGVKALDQRTLALQKENAALKQQLNQQQQELDALKQVVCQAQPAAAVCKH